MTSPSPPSPAPTAEGLTEARKTLWVFVDDHGQTLAPYRDHNGFDMHDRMRTHVRTFLAALDAATARLTEAYEFIGKRNEENAELLAAIEQDPLRALAAETKAADLQALVDGRDAFIVSKGLWSEFVEQLPQVTTP